MTEKKDKAIGHTALSDICRREVGHLSTRKFAHRLAASEVDESIVRYADV
ncbi:hypothetical protein HanOQP8_Chr17g0653601 [Helianthus annuus]|nr:hypothetical protein HanOQP8_Chr17g0653601 [Helianthus annuus]